MSNFAVSLDEEVMWIHLYRVPCSESAVVIPMYIFSLRNLNTLDIAEFAQLSVLLHQRILILHQFFKTIHTKCIIFSPLQSLYVFSSINYEVSSDLVDFPLFFVLL